MALFAYYESPFGLIRIGYENDHIVSICRRVEADAPHTPSHLSDLANSQLQAYFSGSRSSFDLPLDPRGTPFQRLVWHALSEIPYGEVRTYGEIAAAIGNPKACRAVGMACNRNPLWIVIPCHRVVGSDHALTGYAGGLDMKRALLELERNKANISPQ